MPHFKKNSLLSSLTIVTVAICVMAMVFSGCKQNSDKLISQISKPSTSQKTSSESSSLPSSKTSSRTTSNILTLSSKTSTTSSKPSTSSSVPKLIGTNHIICIDPGHQKKVDLSMEAIAPGSTVKKYKNPGGTMGVVTKLPEYALNMIIGQKLEQKLKTLGYTIVMTRTNNDGNISNIGRAEVANNSGAQLFVRIHADATTSSLVNGISVQIPGDQYITNKTMLSQSRQLGACLLSGLLNSTGAKSRGLVVRNDMTGFNWSKVPVVLVEMGFMTNPTEDKAMSTDSYQNKLVDGFVSGINAYFQQKTSAK